MEEIPMSSVRILKLSLRAAGIAAAVLVFGVPAMAGEIYSWRTEDGAYAFTDDAKAVPPRYRDQAKVGESGGLTGYSRLTAAEPGAGSDYAQRLASRLEHLRALNQGLEAARAPQATPAGQTLEVRSGDLNVGVPMDGGSTGPLVIDSVRFRHKGELATRHNVVVSKGGETLAVIKGKRNIGEINQAPDISEMVE
jgi:hypothetical protein